MSNTKSTKRALLFSVMAMLLCVAMLIGTTFAWFTDSVTASGNKIQSGKLNIDLLVKIGNDGYQSVKDSQAPIFNYDKWEPGYTEVRNVMVKTTGNLALKYTLDIVPLNADEDALKLAEVIDVYYANSDVTVTDRSLTGLTRIGTLKDVFTGVAGTAINDTLIPDQGNTEDYATIALKMQESAGNDYQNLSVGGGFDLHVLATQYTYEFDSFDDQYDADATYPVVNAMVLSDPATKAEVMKEDPEDPDAGLHPVFEGKTYSVPGKTLVTADETFNRIDFVNANVTCDTLIKITEPNTVMISDCSITLSEGGKLVVSSDPTAQVLIVGNVTVNGVKLTQENCGMGTELYNQYFQGIGTCFFF